jgi:predicted dienelactone hydrolase
MLVLLVLAALVAPPGALAAKVGTTRLSLTKTSVSTGMPRVLDPVVWYPVAPRRTPSLYAGGLDDGPIQRGRHPLIVFSHGSCGRPTEATYLTTALAARGFIVVAPAHPGNTADDGLAVCLSVQATVDTAANRVPDVQATIDAVLAASEDASSPFAHRIRPSAIGIAGLSFGGFTTLLAAQQEPRLRAALALVPGGTSFLLQGADHDIAIPTMVIGAERDLVVGYAESPLAFARLAGPRFLVKVLAANHLSAVDDCFNEELGISFCVADDITQEQAHALILHYAVPFFRRYLGNARGAKRVLTKTVDGVELTAEPDR